MRLRCAALPPVARRARHFALELGTTVACVVVSVPIAHAVPVEVQRASRVVALCAPEVIGCAGASSCPYLVQRAGEICARVACVAIADCRAAATAIEILVADHIRAILAGVGTRATLGQIEGPIRALVRCAAIAALWTEVPCGTLP